jgi:hypothetical protein
MIRSTNLGHTIQVQKRIGGIRDTDYKKSNPIDWNYGTSVVDFGDIFPDKEIKPQLLHWANQCRNFTKETLAGK